MKIMDRYLFGHFVVAWAICFTSMVGLFIVIDMFANMDEFLEDHPALIVGVSRVLRYYAVHSLEYFQLLSPFITMIAAMTTLAALHRHNEIVALLAAGIPTRRALVPILFGVALFMGLRSANCEIALPYFSEVLQRMHEDIDGNQSLVPTGHIDRDQMLIKAAAADRSEQRLDNVNLTLPMDIVGQLQDVHAEHAYYRPDPETGKMGWLLTGTSSMVLHPNERNRKVRALPDGTVFVHSNVTFTNMIRKQKWQDFASTSELLDELHSDEAKNPNQLRIQIHNRIVQPLLDMLLVLIGLPFVLQWERQNLYRSIAVAMLLCGLFFMADQTFDYFAKHTYIDAITGAWLPVLIFGPVAVALSYRIGT